MRLPATFAFSLLGALLATGATAADRLTLHDGSVVDGEFMGGGRAMLRFSVDGVTHQYPLEQVNTLHFDAVRQPLSAAEPLPVEHALIVPVGEGRNALEIRRVPEGQTGRD